MSRNADGNDEITDGIDGNGDSVLEAPVGGAELFQWVLNAVQQECPPNQGPVQRDVDVMLKFVIARHKKLASPIPQNQEVPLRRAIQSWKRGAIPNNKSLNYILVALYGKNWVNDCKARKLETACSVARAYRLQRYKNHRIPPIVEYVASSWLSETTYFPDGNRRPNQNLIAELVVHVPVGHSDTAADVIVTMTQSVEEVDCKGGEVIYRVFLGQSRLNADYILCEFEPRSRLGDVDGDRTTTAFGQDACDDVQVRLQAGSWKLPSQPRNKAPINGERLLKLTYQPKDKSILTLTLTCYKRQFEVVRSEPGSDETSGSVEKVVKDKVIKAFIQKKLGKNVREDEQICIASAKLTRALS